MTKVAWAGLVLAAGLIAGGVAAVVSRSEGRDILPPETAHAAGLAHDDAGAARSVVQVDDRARAACGASNGVVVPASEVELMAPFDGVVESVEVTIGSALLPGQIVAVMRSDELEGERRARAFDVEQAAAELRVAQLRYDGAQARVRRMTSAAGLFSEQDIAEARLDAGVAAEQVTAARSRASRSAEEQAAMAKLLASGAIKARQKGVVIAVYGKRGSLMRRGEVVVRGVGEGTPRFRFAVDPDCMLALKLQRGSRFQVTAERWTGQVVTAWTSPIVDAKTGTSTLEAVVADDASELPGPLSGGWARAEFLAPAALTEPVVRKP